MTIIIKLVLSKLILKLNGIVEKLKKKSLSKYFCYDIDMQMW